MDVRLLEVWVRVPGKEVGEILAHTVSEDRWVEVHTRRLWEVRALWYTHIQPVTQRLAWVTCLSQTVRTSYRRVRAVRREDRLPSLISLLLSHFLPCLLIIFSHHFSSSVKVSQSKVAILRVRVRDWKQTSSPPKSGWSQQPPAHQSGYTRVFWELVEFTFNVRISKVLAALWPRLLTRQSLFVPPDVFRALSQQFLLHCIRTYIQCGTWRAAKPALLRVALWKKLSIWADLFSFLPETLVSMKWLFIASGYSADSNLSGDKDYARNGSSLKSIVRQIRKYNYLTLSRTGINFIVQVGHVHTK